MISNKQRLEAAIRLLAHFEQAGMNGKPKVNAAGQCIDGQTSPAGWRFPVGA